ncbi:MAG: cytochrome P450 [Pseudomonadota bacterium]|nr:cytochrome P450 [Pseudomonadota bacterium]
MKPTTLTECPYRSPSPDQGTARAPLHPPGSWPPGPPSGLTGWGLLRRLSRDLLGTLADWRAQYGDIFHVRSWPEHQVVLAEPELVRELLVQQPDALIRWERGIQVFSQLHGKSVLTTEGDLWRRKRQALQPAFSPKQVQSFVPVIAAAAAKAFSGWPADGARWPIESALTSLGMDVSLRMLFSSEIDQDARAAEWAVHAAASAGNAELYWPASWPDWMPWKRTKRRAIGVLNRLIDRQIQARLSMTPATWPTDLLSRLLRLQQEDPSTWSLRAVRDECMTAFLAGHQTAAATLTWWAWCMAANPAAQSRARSEVLAVLSDAIPADDDLPKLAYLTQTLQETLRLYPAVPVLLSRRSTRAITVGGWQLPARTMLTIPVQLLHHDPRWFPDPAVFQPDRFAADAPAIPRGAFIPFGTGPRVCLGQHLAMAEMTVVAAMLLQRFVLSIADGVAAPEPVFNITLRPKQPLRLTLSARSP